MKVYLVAFKVGSYRIMAANPQNAMRDFMRRVMIEQIGLEDLDQIGTVLEEGKPKPRAAKPTAEEGQRD